MAAGTVIATLLRWLLSADATPSGISDEPWTWEDWNMAAGVVLLIGGMVVVWAAK